MDKVLIVVQMLIDYANEKSIEATADDVLAILEELGEDIDYDSVTSWLKENI